MYQDLNFDVADKVATITLNRPKKLNALSQGLYRELQHALIRADIDSAIEVVVITGAGRAFCSGGDLSDPARQRHDRDTLIELCSHAAVSHALFAQIENMSKVVIAKVNGLAHAGGLTIVQQCDIAIASSVATFRAPEGLRGLANPYGAARLASYVGVARAKYLLLTATEFTAVQALDWGLIALVAEPDKLDATTDEVIEQVLRIKSAPRSLNKHNINRTLPPFDEYSLAITEMSLGAREGTMRWASNASPAEDGSA